MKQVLTTLVKLLSNLCAISSCTKSRDMAVARLFDIIFCTSQHLKAKPALHALNLFISRSLISPYALLDRYKTWLAKSHAATTESVSPQSVMHNFLVGIFDWIPQSDVARTAGQVIRTLLTTYQAGCGDRDHRKDQILWSPVWVEPLLKSLEDHSNDLQAYQNHLFPAIFTLSCLDYWLFLKFLGVEEYMTLRGAVIENSRSYQKFTQFQIPILFSALQVGKESGLVVSFGE